MTDQIQKPVRWKIVICFVLTMVTFAVYWPVRHHDFVNYDDPLFITGKTHVLSGLSWENTRWAFQSHSDDYWRPLTLLSFMLDCQLFGLNAGGHHLSSVFLHALNSILVFLVFFRLTGAMRRSALVAGLFAWHPLHVEPVAWAADRGDVLGGCFWMLTLLTYAGFAQARMQSSKAGTKYFFLALFFFACGLMSKPTLVTLPCVLLLLDYWPLKRFSPGNLFRLFLEKLPFLALSALSSFITYFGQQRSGAIGQSEGVTAGIRLGNALVSFVRYLGKTFWPTNLTVFYPHPGTWPLWQILSAGVLMFVISFFVVRWARRRPYLVVGWLWFLGILVPMIGLIQVGGHSMADRYSYISLIGVFVMLVWLVADLLPASPHRTMPQTILGCAIMAACLVGTRMQLRHWRNSEALWTHSLLCNPRDDVAQTNLGNALIQQGRLSEGIVHCNNAIEIQPRNAKAHYDLGYAYFKLGRTDDAIQLWRKAIEIDPSYPDAHSNLGLALFEKGQVDEAIAHWEKTVRVNAEHATSHSNLGHALLQTGRTAEAVSHLEKAIEINPRDANAHNELGDAFFTLNRMDQAITHWRRSIEINPNQATVHYSLGLAYFNSGQMNQAMAYYQKALALDPNDPDTLNDLADVLFESGQMEAAIVHLKKAIALDPQSLTPRNNLAWALATGPVASLRNGIQAVTLAEQTVQLDGSKSPELLRTLAAAYAEAGRFSDAVKTAQQALQLVAEARNQTLTDTLRKELALYEEKHPCRSDDQTTRLKNP